MRLLYLLIITACMVAAFASAAENICGNDVCEKSESHLYCPDDCVSGGRDNYCDNADDGRCDPDCLRTDADCGDYVKASALSGEGPSNIFKVLFVVVFLTAVSGTMYYLYKKANKGSAGKMYEEKQIDTFTNIHQQKQDSWSTSSEKEIMDKIKQSEDFKKYSQ